MIPYIEFISCLLLSGARGRFIIWVFLLTIFAFWIICIGSWFSFSPNPYFLSLLEYFYINFWFFWESWALKLRFLTWLPRLFSNDSISFVLHVPYILLSFTTGPVFWEMLANLVSRLSLWSWEWFWKRWDWLSEMAAGGFWTTFNLKGMQIALSWLSSCNLMMLFACIGE